MKLLIVINLIFFMLYGCGLSHPSDPVRRFIPGIYARHYSDEFSERYDTIEIKNQADIYSIVKRSRIERKVDGEVKEPEYQLSTWTGSYDKTHHFLWLRPDGKAILFEPNSKQLRIGGQPYKKL